MIYSKDSNFAGLEWDSDTRCFLIFPDFNIQARLWKIYLEKITTLGGEKKGNNLIQKNGKYMDNIYSPHLCY